MPLSTTTMGTTTNTNKHHHHHHHQWIGFLPLYRLLVAAICIFLFPFFILSTLVSGILGLIINRMVHPHTNAASSGGGAAAAATTTTTATLTSATEDDDRHHNHIHHDDDDDEDDDPQDNMEYWLQRCSICFEAQLDLCLDYCRDQYCLDCFRRQVTMLLLHARHSLIYAIILYLSLTHITLDT